MKLTYKELTTLVQLLERQVGYADEDYKKECEYRENVKKECLEKVKNGVMTWDELESTVKHFDDFCDKAWQKSRMLDNILEKITEEIEI